MDELEKVKSVLYEKDASLVVMFNNGSINSYYNRRVHDIVGILKNNQNALKDAVIADKVIGKVAASILAYAGVKRIFARVLSKYAISVLENNNISYEYETLTPYVINNDKTGMCPMENKFKDESDIKVIYDYFLNTK